MLVTLPRGEVRDRALSVVVAKRAVSGGSIDRGMLDAFASDAARQETVFGMMLNIARRDPNEAQALLDSYVTDPGLQRWARAMITAAR